MLHSPAGVANTVCRKPRPKLRCRDLRLGSSSPDMNVGTCGLGVQVLTWKWDPAAWELTCILPLWSCGSTWPDGSSCSVQGCRGQSWDRGSGELIVQWARHWPADWPKTCTAYGAVEVMLCLLHTGISAVSTKTKPQVVSQPALLLPWPVKMFGAHGQGISRSSAGVCSRRLAELTLCGMKASAHKGIRC